MSQQDDSARDTIRTQAERWAAESPFVGEADDEQAPIHPWYQGYTPFVEGREQEDVYGPEAEWESELAALEAEGPLQGAFDRGRTSPIRPEDLEEDLEGEFAEEDEWPDVDDFHAHDGEAQDEAALTDSEDSIEELYDDEEAPYADAEAEEEAYSYPEDTQPLEESFIPEGAWIKPEQEDVAYPPGDTPYEEEEPSLAEEFFVESEELLRLFDPGGVVQRVQQLFGKGVFGLSLLKRFASGQIWNEDHLALEVLFHRNPRLRPADLGTVSGSERLRLLNKLAVTHERVLTAIRERDVRPIFGNPANFPVGSAGGCQIRDLRGDVRRLGPQLVKKGNKSYYKRNAGKSPRKQAAVDSIVLHQMAFNRGNDVNSYKKVGAHYIVTADGQIAQLYDDLDHVNASNGLSSRSVAIELAGNFPDDRFRWWKEKAARFPERCYLTPAQIRAGRCLLATLKNRIPSINYIYAHRQSSDLKPNDPGPDAWFNIAEWALNTVNLTDRSQTSVGTGQAIPKSWRMSRPAMTATNILNLESFVEPEEEEFDWETFVSEQSPAIPAGIAEFAATLGKEWAKQRNGSPSAEKMTGWLLQDYQDTLEGARNRWGKKYGDGSIGRAWMISRREQMNFQTLSSAGIKPLQSFQPPTDSVALVSTSLIKGSDEAPVAPIMVRFVQGLRQHYRGSLDVSTYRGHGGGRFNGRGYSIDLFLQGSDGRGFYPPEEAVRFLRALREAAKATNAQWRVIYNDFSVADTINRESGQKHVIFVGKVRGDKKITGLNWHGPHPLILHFHLDLVPRASAPDARVGVPSVSVSEPMRSLAQQLQDALRRGQWALALGFAVLSGNRDASYLTNLVFFARHPERQGRPLTRGEPDFERLGQEWLDIRDRLVKPALDQALPAGGRK